jgi:hypothetical protein
MLVRRVRLGAGLVIVGLAVVLAPAAPAFASHDKTNHPKQPKSSGTSTEERGARLCPAASLLSTAFGFTESSPQARPSFGEGNEECQYAPANSNSDITESQVGSVTIYVYPKDTNSVLAQLAHDDGTTQQVSGIGKSAFLVADKISGGSDLFVYQSSAPSFSIQGSTASTTQLKTLARAIVGGQ